MHYDKTLPNRIRIEIQKDAPDVLKQISIAYGASYKGDAKMTATANENPYSQKTAIIITLSTSTVDEKLQILDWLQNHIASDGELLPVAISKIKVIDPGCGLAERVFDFLFENGPQPDILDN